MIFSKGVTSLSSTEKCRKFSNMFGPMPDVIYIIWKRLKKEDLIPTKGQPKHLLWGLMFLRTNMAEDMMTSITRSCRNTTRKWKWKLVYALKELKIKVV